MSPRPRKVTDEQIFAAAYRVMNRLGPGELTLADIAAEAGVTAGALVQRFGSKRALLLALSAAHAASAGELLQSLRSAHGSPLAAVCAYAECMAGLAESPAALARSLAYLQIDLADPDFRRHLKRQSQATRAGLAALLQSALDEGELRAGTDTERLARTVETVVGGSLFSWAAYREGAPRDWLLEDMDAVLAPHRAAAAPASRRAARAARRASPA
jgi:AcrR family transcriptional regulator